MIIVGSVLRPVSRHATTVVILAIDGDRVTYAPVGFESSSSLHAVAPMSLIQSRIANGAVVVEVA